MSAWECRVGLQQPTVTVRYRGLSVLARTVVGDRSLPTLKKTAKQHAEVGGGRGGTCRSI